MLEQLKWYGLFLPSSSQKKKYKDNYLPFSMSNQRFKQSSLESISFSLIMCVYTRVQNFFSFIIMFVSEPMPLTVAFPSLSFSRSFDILTDAKLTLLFVMVLLMVREHIRFHFHVVCWTTCICANLFLTLLLHELQLLDFMTWMSLCSRNLYWR